MPIADTAARPHGSATSTALGLGDSAVQSNLHQFAVSLWLHFFRQPGSADVHWKECHRRRRRDFFAANRQEARDFIDFIALHAPENQKAQCVAAVNARRHDRYIALDATSSND
jgi:hypothetical protein